MLGLRRNGWVPSDLTHRVLLPGVIFFTIFLAPLFTGVNDAGAGGTITLLGQLGLVGQRGYSDVWGWVDPNTNKEYAIVGEWNGYGDVIVDVYIVDVSDPTNPTLTSTIQNIPGFDVKTWGNYLYTCDGGVGNLSAIYDISNPALPVSVGSFPTSHNIAIENGYMYLEFPGLRIYNLDPDPAVPTYLWGNASDGHDATIIGNTLYDFHGYSGTNIYDIVNPATPVLLGSITDISIIYHHSGWPSSDGNYLFLNDELATSPTADITVWNISNPAAPFKVGEYNDPTATIHNSFRVGNYLHTSYYTSGYRVFDISDPLNMVIADEYDTSPLAGESTAGAWGCYPFAPSGNIYVTDEQTGLYIFSFVPTPTGITSDPPASFSLGQNYPNPFNPTTRITYALDNAGHVLLDIYDARGGRVRTLVNGAQSAGPQSATWDGRDDARLPVASGVYFYKLRTAGGTDTNRMVLLK